MFSPILLHDFLTRSANRFPEKTALVCGDRRVTYAGLERDATRFAAALAELGVRRHDRVVIFLDNSVESVVALYGILGNGGAFVMLNGTMKAGKLNYILRDSGATLLVAHTDKASVVREALEGITALTLAWVGRRDGMPPIPPFRSVFWDDLIERPAGGFAPPRCIDQDLASLIYTSGSTGEPKGVVSSHRNMVSAARSIIEYLENTSDDVVIDVLPLSFDYGLYQVLMAVAYGGTVVLEKSFNFPVRILETIGREKVTGFPLVPTIVAFLLKMTSLDKYDLRSLRYMTNTGAALPVEHIRRLRALLPDVKLYSMFGLTECKRVCYLPPSEVDRRPASVGKAMPNCEVFVVDEEGREVPPGTVGELVIRGGNVMRGYWNAPELTARTYRPGRIPGETVLYSGDLFRMDEEGFLYFLGRKDDMIKSKGERISPKEVENVLSGLDGVAEVAVIGIPDEILGQAIKAFIIRRPGSDIGERDVLKHASARMESFMVPKHVVFMEDLPRTPNGKIDKKALKAMDTVS